MPSAKLILASPSACKCFESLAMYSVGNAGGPLLAWGHLSVDWASECRRVGAHPCVGFKLCTPWNMRSPFAPTSFLHGTTGRWATRSAEPSQELDHHQPTGYAAVGLIPSRSSVQNPYRELRYLLGPPATGSHTWSAEPLCELEPSPHQPTMYATRPPMKCIGAQCRTPSASITTHGHSGATRPPPVGGNSQLPQARTSRRAETWRHLSGCLESSAKNQRAGRCLTHSKSAIIRPAVTGHNLIKTIIRDHLRPLVELIRQSNPGKHGIGRRGCVPQGSRSRHH